MEQFGTSQNLPLPNQLLLAAEVANACELNCPSRLRIGNVTRIGFHLQIIFMLVRLHPPHSQSYSLATNGSVSHKPSRANPEIGKRAATLPIFQSLSGPATGKISRAISILGKPVAAIPISLS
jgi:hypothetical protein